MSTIEGFRGPVLRPGDPGYDETRRIWNGSIDRRPALIARCTGAADVAAAVRFAAAHDLLVAVRAGGHSIPGFSVCDDGLMIDLQPMKGVRVDPGRRTATAQPGLTWAELDGETQAWGLAVTGGEISDTGIAGLTLGGGFGWLARPFGLTCDNLLAADVVTADGELVRASEDDNHDLFWALRGGGGNFGIVTSFEYRLHPVGPVIVAGAVMHPLERGDQVLRFYREWAADQPDHVTSMGGVVTAPPAPFVPPELHGRPVVLLAAAHIGPLDEGQAHLASLRAFGPPAADLVGPMPYVALQSMIDDALPPGLPSYVKSEWLAGMTDEVIDGVLDHFGRATSPLAQVLMRQLGGAVRRVPPGATAFAFRDVEYVLTVPVAWTDPTADPAPHRAWARGVWEACRSASSGGVYVNHMDADEGEDRLRQAYPPDTWRRLVEVKTRWDPTNRFRLNQNIRPVEPAAARRTASAAAVSGVFAALGVDQHGQSLP